MKQTYKTVMGWLAKMEECAQKVVDMSAGDATLFLDQLAKARDVANGSEKKPAFISWNAARASRKPAVQLLVNRYNAFTVSRHRALTKPTVEVMVVGKKKKGKGKTAKAKYNATVTAFFNLTPKQRKDFLNDEDVASWK